jgi:hypothetical protein
MTALIALLGFVVVVGVLAALDSRRTGARGCCAPADPTRDIRMCDVNVDPSPAGARSRA